MEEKNTGTERQGERWEGEEKKTVKGEEGQNEKQRTGGGERKSKNGWGWGGGVLGGKKCTHLHYTKRGGESNWNSKTLFYGDCSLGSVKNLTTSPC